MANGAASADLGEIERAARPYLAGGKTHPATGEPMFALLALVPGPPEASGQLPPISLRYWSANLASRELSNMARNFLSRKARAVEYQKLGVDQGQIARIANLRTPVTFLNPRKTATEARVTGSEVLARWVPLGLVYIMFVTLLVNIGILLNSLVEERTSRVLQILISTLTPSEILSGKVVGTAMTGITMMLGWIGLTVCGLLVALPLFFGINILLGWFRARGF